MRASRCRWEALWPTTVKHLRLLSPDMTHIPLYLIIPLAIDYYYITPTVKFIIIVEPTSSRTRSVYFRYEEHIT